MSTKKKEPPKLNYSENIAQFTHMAKQIQSDFTWHTERMKKMDALTQDYLHQLELEDLTYNERAKIATALAKTRQERRASKDVVECLRPLNEYFSQKKGVETLKNMSEILGKVRIIEECFEKRVYIPRVLGKEENPLN